LGNITQHIINFGREIGPKMITLQIQRGICPDEAEMALPGNLIIHSMKFNGYQCVRIYADQGVRRRSPMSLHGVPCLCIPETETS